MIVQMLADQKTSSNMTDSSQPNKKKKVTLKASEQGIIKSEKALIRLGFESKSNFAESQLISRSTVTKFFQGEPIQLDSLRRICSALELRWQEIAGMSAAEENFAPSFALNISNETEAVVEQMPNPHRKITVIDPNSEKIKAVITLEGDVDSVDNWEIIQLLLRQHSGHSINIIDIKSGSIRLTVEGSPADIQQLIDKIRAGELLEVDGLSVQNIEFSTKSLDANKIDKSIVRTIDKWDLVKAIVDRRITNRNLRGSLESLLEFLNRLVFSYFKPAQTKFLFGRAFKNLFKDLLCGADLSDVNLSDVNLSSADLSSADLSGADLSGADLFNANLSGADLINSNLSGAYLINSNLSGADLSDANLSGVYLINSNLINSNLINADLSGANLINADLRGADLINSNLINANLRGADLRGVNLRGANVKETRFGENQGISESMKLDLQQRGAIFEDAPGDRSATRTLK
jgi:uncharacterized protein YjbI with pentapeptide repeats/DNA-binding Xre family transcriptional regulator